MGWRGVGKTTRMLHRVLADEHKIVVIAVPNTQTAEHIANMMHQMAPYLDRVQRLQFEDQSTGRIFFIRNVTPDVTQALVGFQPDPHVYADHTAPRAKAFYEWQQFVHYRLGGFR